MHDGSVLMTPSYREPVNGKLEQKSLHDHTKRAEICVSVSLREPCKTMKQGVEPLRCFDGLSLVPDTTMRIAPEPCGSLTV